MLNLIPDQFLLLAIAVSVSAGVLGASWRPAMYMVTVGAMRWLLWPILQNAFAEALQEIPFWALILSGPLIGVFAWCVAIRFLQTVLSLAYGRYVAARVVSAALIASFRTIGRILGWLLFLPRRAFTRRQQLDEMLRNWRRH